VLNESLYSSDKIEWETPHHLFEKLNIEFAFTLDACASAANAKCPRYFTIDDDALEQNWSGRVWMNPPYGRQISHFVAKAHHEASCGHADLIVCLLPVRSDTRWWHQHCMRAQEIRLLTRRLEFVGSSNKAPFPACIVVYRGAGASCGGYPNLSSYTVELDRDGC
jgi:phage N-6-adenine-methyltransferase